MNVWTRRHFLQNAGVGGVSLAFTPSLARAHEAVARRPNLIFILADDLGYAELGCYGQKRIRTPHIDALAADGIRFTQCYSGSPVCAPSRCVLLTGQHAGHAAIRDNREVDPEGQYPLPAGAMTLPRLLRSAGYQTALIGKWGLGYPGSSGDPLKQGFDSFFGYNCQRKAHDHYPKYLWRNDEKLFLKGNSGEGAGSEYAPALMEEEACRFIRGVKDHPFFLFFATTLPHLALQVPDDAMAEYEGAWDDPPYDGSKGYMAHPRPRAAYAAMVTRLDRAVGRIVRQLDELGLTEDTLIVFSSDNGSTTDIGGYDPAFFQGTGTFRAAKGSLYDGGIRVPFIARWPGRVRRAATSNLLFAFQDVLPTFLDVAGRGANVPPAVDGISIVPELFGRPGQTQHESLYIEYPSNGGQQMTRCGEWKGIRRHRLDRRAAPIELYNLETDPSERSDVAALHPDIVARMRHIMLRAHTPSPAFPIPAIDG